MALPQSERWSLRAISFWAFSFNMGKVNCQEHRKGCISGMSEHREPDNGHEVAGTMGDPQTWILFRLLFPKPTVPNRAS